MPADDVERWRVFLAIEIPDAVREALRGPLDALAPLGEWLRPNTVERIHLTLHFLGHLPVPQVEELARRLEPIVMAHPRLRLAVDGVGAFPHIRRPQVLWAGVGGADVARLTALQIDLGRELTRAGLPVEDRFHPHLTLARVRKPLRAPARRMLDAWHAAWREVQLGEFPVDAVRLMRSELSARPPRYTTVATFALE
jgi:2'-5' RNA ligase